MSMRVPFDNVLGVNKIYFVSIRSERSCKCVEIRAFFLLSFPIQLSISQETFLLTSHIPFFSLTHFSAYIFLICALECHKNACMTSYYHNTLTLRQCCCCCWENIVKERYSWVCDMTLNLNLACQQNMLPTTKLNHHYFCNKK